tara:strand:+ start:4834 stop:5976 length:1143 start_codon:yes stop_codon:yes gene_type:complete
MYTTYLNNELIIGSYDKERSSSIHQTNAGLGVQNKIIDLKDESYDGDFDIFILHGYQIGECSSKGQFLFDKKIKCKTFVIDLMGEYKKSIEFREYEDIFSSYIEYENVKVIGIYEDTDTIRYKDWQFFKHKNSWLFFINPQNNTFHKWNNVEIPTVICGSKWREKTKTHLFQCLNNQMRPHRIFMVNEILKRSIKSDFILSSRESEYDGEKSPKILIDDVVESEIEKIKKDRFGIQTQFSDKCYIDVVTETMYDGQFITEKAVKPFYSLQIPIIFGYKGIIKYFEDLGFDMFRDIINHKYDEMDDVKEKAKYIADELHRLSLIEDFHSIYIDSKERLLSNQHLLNYYNFSSNRHKELAKFMFGDSFSSLKCDENYNTLYL